MTDSILQAPRLLTKEEAARYCGLSARRFLKYIGKNVTFRRFGQKKLWDIRALDAYLDELYETGEDDILKTLDGFGQPSLRNCPAKQERL
jgi:hypothetical protein